eukprot:PhF_6_TR2175/c0_g5_i1/m.3558
MGTYHPLSIYNAQNVTIRNTVAKNGVLMTLFTGGGCMTLRGVRGVTVLQHLVIQRCTSIRNGGGVLIDGPNETSVDEASATIPLYQFGGDVFVQNVSISYCQSTQISGGAMHVSAVTSLLVADSRFEHNVALDEGGCFGTTAIIRTIMILNVYTLNCTARGCGGALRIAPYE